MNKKENNKIIITNIFWKRTYLFIEYESAEKVELMLKNNSNIHILENKQLAENKYRSKINITIADGRENLKPGKWYLMSKSEKILLIENNILENIDNLSKVFLYNNKNNAYIVTFEINDENPIILSLNVSYMKKNKHPQKSNECFIKKIVIIILNFLYKFLSIFKNKNKILFLSQNMNHIRDNMEILNNRLYERKLNQKYKIIYNFVNIFDGKIRILYWLKVIKDVATSKYIFVDDYVPLLSFLNVDKNTIITQMWHAGFGFKLVGYGRFGIKGTPHPYNSCHRKYTYGIVGNEYLKEIYSEVWGIEKEALLPTGLPRLENFLDNNIQSKAKEKLTKKFPQFTGKRIITFAPTYRGISQKEAHYDYNKIDFSELYKLCKETNSVVIFSQHHFITSNVPIPKEYNDLIYDLSDYKLNDLFYSTDILITDYSSCFYDFLLLNRPIIFYVYDKDIYCATRGIHRSIEKIAPGEICYNFTELINTIKKGKFKNVKRNNLLIDNCVYNNKKASDQIIDYVILNER